MHDGKRRAVAVLGAVVIVAGLALLTTSVLGAIDGDDDRQTVGLGPVEEDRTTADRSTTTRRATTTTAAPQVLGENTERTPDSSTTTTSTTASTVAASPANPAAPPPPQAGPAAPPTTTCRNSTDPACGPLVWDPAPAPDEVEVVEVSVPRSAVVGEEVTFTVEYGERAGADALGACATWSVRDDPGVPSVSTCEAVNHSCGRYGPHTPPPPSDDRVAVTRTVVFTTPGEHEVTVGGNTATHLPDGCASPYLASWSRTYLVVVEAA